MLPCAAQYESGTSLQVETGASLYHGFHRGKDDDDDDDSDFLVTSFPSSKVSSYIEITKDSIILPN